MKTLWKMSKDIDVTDDETNEVDKFDTPNWQYLVAGYRPYRTVRSPNGADPYQPRAEQPCCGALGLKTKKLI